MDQVNINIYEKLLRLTTVTQLATTILLTGVLILTSTLVFADDNYQHNALLNPGDSLLKAEARGRIMIYDGIHIAMVDKAMDEQFDRIDHMMFVRTLHQSDDGGVEADDDC